MSRTGPGLISSDSPSESAAAIPTATTGITLLSYALAGLPPAGTAGRLARLTDSVRGIVMDTGSRWSHRTSRWILGEDFNIIADGSTDDTAALQAAVDAAAGNPILLPPGTIVLTSQITYDTSSAFAASPIIIGAGRRRTIIDNRVANASCFRFRSTSANNFQYGGLIRDLSIATTTSPASSNGVEIQGLYQFSMENVRINGLTGDGFRITMTSGDADGSVEPILRRCWIEDNAGWGLNVNASSGLSQVSFLSCYNTYFRNNTLGGTRYIGQFGKFDSCAWTENNGAGAFRAAYNAINNQGLTLINCAFENNYVRDIDLESLHTGEFIACEFASTVASFTQTIGVNIGKAASGDVKNVAFRGSHVRKTTASHPTHTMFSFETARSDLCTVENTNWFDYSGGSQVRYGGNGLTGGRNRFSDGFTNHVANAASVTLANGDNHNVALPADGTIMFIEGPTLAFAITGLTNGWEGRELIIVNNSGQALTLKESDVNSAAANRIQADNGVNVTVNVRGSARLVYWNAKWNVCGTG